MTRKALIAAAVVAAFAPSVPASAATGATDTAVPVYRTGTAASTSNRFECVGDVCSFVITTKTTNFPCTSEVVVLSSGQPALLYQNTFCQVSIVGTFEPTEDDAGQCVLQAVQSLKVRFTSGANAAFNGAFDASGFFKPIAFTTGVEGLPIAEARVTVTGADTLDDNPVGTGKIKGTSFVVRFPGGGPQYTLCSPRATGSRTGYVTSVTSHGTITIAP